MFGFFFHWIQPKRKTTKPECIAIAGYMNMRIVVPTRINEIVGLRMFVTSYFRQHGKCHYADRGETVVVSPLVKNVRRPI